jgi:hypothetical protein
MLAVLRAWLRRRESVAGVDLAAAAS